MAMADASLIDKTYDRCAYLNCYNGKNSTGHRLFRFPAYSDSRHNLWIRYTGNVRLRMWSSATVRRSGICGDHFGPESFTDETRRSLRRHAVPKPYSATDTRTKPSHTLLAHIESLPRKRTTRRKFVDADVFRKKLGSNASPESFDADDSIHISGKPTTATQTHIADTVKTLRKVKIIKIEEQNSNANRTVILERCKNPETCPANRQSTQIGEKHRPHFHKVFVNNFEIATPASASVTNVGVERKTDKIVSDMRIIDERLEESCDDSTNVATGDDEGSGEKMRYRLERYLINVTKSTPRELSTTTRNSGKIKEITRSVINGSNIHTEKGEPTMIQIPDYISKKHPSTTELVKEYYRTKDERIFDRCAYLNCNNGRYTTGARLFRFPQFTDPRLNTWIKNAGNPRMLYWSSATIRRAGLCGDHFTDESFFNETRQRLLRNALPKPFYLDAKKVSGTKLQDENLTRDDLIRIFEGLDEDICDETIPTLIDLPDDKFNNRDDLKIKYPFENDVISDDNEDQRETGSLVNAFVKNEPPDENRNHQKTDNLTNAIVKNEPSDENRNHQETGNPAKMNVKNEPPDETDDTDNEDNDRLSFASECTDFKNEPIDDTEENPLPDDDIVDDFHFKEQNNSQQIEDIRGIIALEQEKVELCKTIKQFSRKLRNAKIRKKKLRSQLIAYNESKIH